MSNIDKRAVQAVADLKAGYTLGHADVEIIQQMALDAVTLMDELEAAEKRIAELSHHLQCAHAFIEHTEAFGYEASNGILCCGDAQWNIDASKSALAAAGKGD
ncbi:hypothetical protein [Enterobacter hormaechei]|uniref:hypothetical protein n=1 Tax=Enterobacter hormaechei TaxID=158836 RepID=UPI000B1D198F|nr:hypothetical protein [Enterobacter hormaechei]